MRAFVPILAVFLVFLGSASAQCNGLNTYEGRFNNITTGEQLWIKLCDAQLNSHVGEFTFNTSSGIIYASVSNVNSATRLDGTYQTQKGQGSISLWFVAGTNNMKLQASWSHQANNFQGMQTGMWYLTRTCVTPPVQLCNAAPSLQGSFVSQYNETLEICMNGLSPAGNGGGSLQAQYMSQSPSVDLGMQHNGLVHAIWRPTLGMYVGRFVSQIGIGNVNWWPVGNNVEGSYTLISGYYDGSTMGAWNLTRVSNTIPAGLNDLLCVDFVNSVPNVNGEYVSNFGEEVYACAPDVNSPDVGISQVEYSVESNQPGASEKQEDGSYLSLTYNGLSNAIWYPSQAKFLGIFVSQNGRGTDSFAPSTTGLGLTGSYDFPDFDDVGPWNLNLVERPSGVATSVRAGTSPVNNICKPYRTLIPNITAVYISDAYGEEMSVGAPGFFDPLPAVMQCVYTHLQETPGNSAIYNGSIFDVYQPSVSMFKGRFASQNGRGVTTFFPKGRDLVGTWLFDCGEWCGAASGECQSTGYWNATYKIPQPVQVDPLVNGNPVIPFRGFVCEEDSTPSATLLDNAASAVAPVFTLLVAVAVVLGTAL